MAIEVDGVWVLARSGLRCTLLPKVYLSWLMVPGSWNSVVVEPQAGDMNLGPEWKLDVQGVEKER